MASGDTLIVWGPLQNEAPATLPAALNRRNNHFCLQFDTSTGEYATFSGVLPRHYAGGGIMVYVHHAAASATSGTIGWTHEFERIGDRQQDVDADGFGGASTITAETVSGTSGQVDIVNSSSTDTDSVAVGEHFRLRITRNVAGDTAAGDAELYAVELKEI